MRWSGTATQLIVLFILCLSSCHKSYYDDPSVSPLIIVVWDGVRLSDISRSTAPWLMSVKSQGIWYKNLWSDSYTYTMAGYLTLLSGNIYAVNNEGKEPSPFPLILHKLMKKFNLPCQKVWMVTTKAKICKLLEVRKEAGNFPSPCGSCGYFKIYGAFSDFQTFKMAVNVLQEFTPYLLVVGFAEADIYAHIGDSTGYISAIRQYDRLTARIWNLLNKHDFYSSRGTVLLVTTDHGRHSWDFKDHGDSCSGCKHMFALWLPVENQYTGYVVYDTVLLSELSREIHEFYGLN